MREDTRHETKTNTEVRFLVLRAAEQAGTVKRLAQGGNTWQNTPAPKGATAGVSSNTYTRGPAPLCNMSTKVPGFWGRHCLRQMSRQRTGLQKHRGRVTSSAEHRNGAITPSVSGMGMMLETALSVSGMVMGFGMTQMTAMLVSSMAMGMTLGTSMSVSGMGMGMMLETIPLVSDMAMGRGMILEITSLTSSTGWAGLAVL